MFWPKGAPFVGAVTLRVRATDENLSVEKDNIIVAAAVQWRSPVFVVFHRPGYRVDQGQVRIAIFVLKGKNLAVERVRLETIISALNRVDL